MENKLKESINRLNYLSSELQALYHLCSVKLGMSDSESVVMYTLLNEGGKCLLSRIVRLSGISKQTINSALRGLESRNIITLSMLDGKSKEVSFTQEGRAYAEATAGRLCEAEQTAFSDWSEEEILGVIALLERFTGSFRNQIEKIGEGKE